MLASLGVVGMAWSRTYLQVHWLTDVIAGALLGSGISLLVFAIAQKHIGAASGPSAVQGAGPDPRTQAANAVSTEAGVCTWRSRRPYG
jgi:membrane-associated phospholipid phosphatase